MIRFFGVFVGAVGMIVVATLAVMLASLSEEATPPCLVHPLSDHLESGELVVVPMESKSCP